MSNSNNITIGAERFLPVPDEPNTIVPMRACKFIDDAGLAWGVLVSSFTATESVVCNLWETRRDLFSRVQPAPPTPQAA